MSLTMTYHKQLLTTVYFCHIAGLAGLIYYWDPMFLLWTLLGKVLFHFIGTEIGLHRLLAHKTFKTAKWKERALAWLSIYGLYGSSLGWCANHRVHHKNADKENDPHPSLDVFNTWFWIDTEKHATISPTVIKDLLRDPIHRFMRDHYFKIFYLTLAVFALLVSTKFVVYFFLLPAAMAQLSGGIVNVVCHRWGYRTHETTDLSRNNFWANLYGEFSGAGLHNNHHKYPWKYTTLPDNPKWHEIDLGAWFIRLFLLDRNDPARTTQQDTTKQFLKDTGETAQ
jgi:fatty-acid desaturase